jgi:hypothetical protein
MEIGCVLCEVKQKFCTECNVDDYMSCADYASSVFALLKSMTLVILSHILMCIK